MSTNISDKIFGLFNRKKPTKKPDAGSSELVMRNLINNKKEAMESGFQLEEAKESLLTVDNSAGII